MQSVNGMCKPKQVAEGILDTKIDIATLFSPFFHDTQYNFLYAEPPQHDA